MADRSSSHTGAYLLGQLWIIPAVYVASKKCHGTSDHLHLRLWWPKQVFQAKCLWGP